jgi:hypothetical protein
MAIQIVSSFARELYIMTLSQRHAKCDVHTTFVQFAGLEVGMVQ